MDQGSGWLVAAFLGLLAATLVAATFIAVRWGRVAPSRAVGALAVWLIVSGGLAHLGILGRWETRPPPAVVLFAFGIFGAALLTRTAWARRIARSAPVAVLVGFHAYRFPLELIMHRAYSEGIMPVQMSFSGRNFDIVTGLLAIGLSLWATRGEVPRAILWAFNGLGLALLVNIVSIAIASMPLIAAFGPDRLNVWVTWLPYVWLPTVFVTFALFGHLVLFQSLRPATLHVPER